MPNGFKPMILNLNVNCTISWVQGLLYNLHLYLLHTCDSVDEKSVYTAKNKLCDL